MSKEWIPGKLTPPQERGVLPRPRLFMELDNALDASAILWIAASPGAGKTALIASYLQERNLPALWYRIDAGEWNPAAFFHGLGRVANRAPPNANEAQPPLPDDCPADLCIFTRHHFEHFFRSLQRRTVLVFDDWAPLPDFPLCELVQAALSRLPKDFKVIVISRDEPRAAYARLRANGSMAVLNGNILRLTVDEAVALAEARYGVGTSSATIADLHHFVDGWVVAFLLLLDGLHTGAIMQSALPNERLLFDYLACEVFEGLDHETQDLLLKVAILPVVTPQAAEVVADHTRAATILNRLHRRHGSFMRSAAGPSPTFTFSPVFRRFLLAKGRETITPDERRELACRAANWLAGVGLLDKAIDLLVENADWQAFQNLVAREAPPQLARGGHGVILGWLRKVPPAALEQEPGLCYWLGTSQMLSTLTESRHWLKRAYALYRDRQDRVGTLLSWAAVVEAIFLAWDDFSGLRGWIVIGERLLDDGVRLPAGEVEQRVVGAMFSAMMHSQPDHPHIGTWARRLFALLRTVEDDNRRLLTGMSLFIYYTKWLGEHARAEIVIDILRPPPERLAQLMPMARIMLTMMEYVYHWNRYDIAAAERAIMNGIATAGHAGIHMWDFPLHAQPVYMNLSAGNRVQAGEHLNRLREPLPRHAPLEQAHYHYLAGWQAMLFDDPRRALEHLDQCGSLVDETSGPMQHALTCIALAQTRHALGEDHATPPLLATARKMAKSTGSQLLEFMIAYSEAWFALDARDEAVCLTALGKALRLAHQHNYLNFTWCLPPVLARLCMKALEADIETAFVQRLIRIRSIVPDIPPLHLERWPWPLRVYTLGRFSIVRDDTPLRFTGKAQHKPMEMLKALIALGGREIPEMRLSEILWPEAEGDSAHSSFTTTLSRLRKLIGKKSLHFRDGRLTLDARHCWVDVWAFERALGEAHDAAAPGNLEKALTCKAIGLYHGPFMDAEDDAHWLLAPRERLRKRLVQTVMTCIRRLEEAGGSNRPIALLQKLLAADRRAQELFNRLTARNGDQIPDDPVQFP